MATGRLPDPNSSPLTAKGDLYTYSTVPAKLAVGNNGETLVADSSASPTGLRWQGDFAAGKNKVINGNMDIWQRGTSLTGSSGFVYGADRFRAYAYSSNSTTVSRQTFTPGNAIAGYEPTYFMRTNSNNNQIFIQTALEDVRLLAGQKVTLSFWAKAASALTLGLVLEQNFGTGGSSAVQTSLSNQSITTSWARYSATVDLPSITGKTIGTGSALVIALNASSLNNDFDLWGVQLEAGSVATAFQTATGTLAGELAACQRYYERLADTTSINARFGNGQAESTTSIKILVPFKVRKRTTISAIDYANVTPSDEVTNPALTSITINAGGLDVCDLKCTVTGATQYRPYILYASTAGGYIGFSAEL